MWCLFAFRWEDKNVRKKRLIALIICRIQIFKKKVPPTMPCNCYGNLNLLFPLNLFIPSETWFSFYACSLYCLKWLLELIDFLKDHSIVYSVWVLISHKKMLIEVSSQYETCVLLLLIKIFVYLLQGNISYHVFSIA